MSKRRVVITGVGLVTPLGWSVDQIWADLCAGKSGIRMISRFDTKDFNVKFGGEVLNWEGPLCYEGPERAKATKRLDRFAQFALSAASDAIKDAGLDFSKEDPWKCGSIIGTGIGGMEEFYEGQKKMMEKGPSRVSPFMVPKLMGNAAAGNVAIEYGLRGPNFSIATACASAGHSLASAFDLIRSGVADIIVGGGSEAALNPIGLACFQALRALSTRNDDPAAASRPWDKDRDGFVLSEGAGIVILEEYEHARKRGAKIYCELLGTGQSCDGSHITAPLEDGAGAAYAMQQALRDAGRPAGGVGYVNAHGTSTELGDLAETRAVKSVFGDDTKIWVSSTKSMTGHTLGAAGGIEAVICAKTIETQTVHPTINLDNPGEGCTLDYVPKTARSGKIEMAMSNSFGFGGHNVSLLFGKV